MQATKVHKDNTKAQKAAEDERTLQTNRYACSGYDSKSLESYVVFLLRFGAVLESIARLAYL